MNESFVFHADFIDHLPEEYKTEWALYAINYGIYGNEPAFENPLIAELWRKIKVRIDTDKDAYTERKEKNRLKLQKWRESHGVNGNNNVTVTNGYEPLQEVTDGYSELQVVTPYTDTRSVYDSEYESVSEYVNEYEYVFDTDAKKDLPLKETLTQQKYSNQVFEIFKAAGLPCSKENRISFLQTDFKNALSFIHSSKELQGFTSKDIVEACKNYVEVLQDETCYYKTKHNFYGLVKSKVFYNLLPANFNKETFLNFATKEQPQEKPEKKIFINDPCPKCKATKIWWSYKKNCYICDECKNEFGIDEILGGY